MDDGSDQADGPSDQNLNFDQRAMAFSGLKEFESHQEDRPYKCNQCDKSYRHAGSLVNHKKTHQIGLYACLICQKEYSNPMGLKSHLRTHSEEKRFKCEQCGEAFRMSQQLYNHRKSLHGCQSTPNGDKMTRSPKFEVQSSVFVESSNLMSNLENYIAESMLPVDFPQLVSKYYPDEKAGEGSPAKEDAEEHEAFTDEKDQPNDSNVEEYRYKCPQCGKSYKHAGSLANHKQSHMVGIYQCAVCYKEFSNLMAMKNHCRLHSDSRARRSCKSPRPSRKSAGVHIDRSEPPKIEVLQSAEKANDPPILPDSSENIKSEDDKEAVLGPPAYQDDLAPSLSPPGKANSDDVTDATFSSDSMIESRNEEESKETAKDFLVEQPDYDDGREEDARFGDRPFKCQECGKTYRHAGSLINHKKTHQTGVYSCSLCSKQMFNMAALKNHLRAHFKSRAGKRLGDAYFPSAGLSDELYQNQEDFYPGEICEISTNESDFLQHQLLQQKQEINEISNDKRVEEVPESGVWQEAPQVSQGSSDDSAYSSGPVFPDVIKIEKDNLVLQRWGQDDSLATPHEIKLETGDADVQNADDSFKQPQPEGVTSREPESLPLEGHPQSTDDRPHKCEICGRTYRHKSSLINHKLTHKTGVYQCSLCPKQYSNLMALRNHVRFHSRSYAGRRGRASRRGRQFFRTKPRFLQNKNGHFLAAPVRVNDKVPHVAAAGSRAVQDPLNEPQSHCTCGKSFDCSEHFQTHRKSCPSAIASPEKTPTDVQCEVSISTATENDLSKVKEPVEPHEKVSESSENHRRRVYECNLCSKSYRHSGSLINHKRTHQTGDYMCPYCSKHVHNMAALKNHIRIHHKVKKGQPGELHFSNALLHSDFSYPSDGKGLYSCVSCEERFHTENDLLAHQMVHLPLEDSRWDHQGPKSSSPEVNKDTAFGGAGDYDWGHSNNPNFQDDEHKPLDTQPEYTCVECGEVYDRIDDLNDHKRSHQAGIYQCSFCPKEYPNLLALRSHFETHTKPQTLRNTSLDGAEGNEFVDSQLPSDNHYDCGHCGLIFSNEVDFHQHQVAHEKQQVMEEPLPEPHGEDQGAEFSFSMHSSERELLSRIKSEIEETEQGEASDGGTLLSHICGFCGKTYDDLESLQAHGFSHRHEESSANENLHPEADEKRQEHGAIIQNSEGSGSTAKNGESPERRPYTCEQCGKTYRHGGSLVNHKKTHLVGNFQCVGCSRHYPNLAAYTTHLRHHPKCKQPPALRNRHPLQTSTVNDRIQPGGDEKPFSPPSSVPLPFSFASRGNGIEKYADSTNKDGCLQDHPSSQYYNQTPQNKNSRRRFSRRIVRINEVQSSKKSSLESPFMSEALNVSDVEEKNLQVCEFCGKLLRVEDLALHRTGNCGASGTLGERNEVQDPPVLPNFAVSQNEGETGFHRRPFRCEVCGRSYRHAGSLINHKQTHKTGIFRCSICQKRFFNLMAMKNHNRIHFELKRHKCLDCGKAFRLRKQLDTHQRIHRQRASAKKSGRRNRKSRYRRFSQGHRQKSLPVSSVGNVNDASEKSFESRVKREMDPDSRPYQCEQCGRSYRHAGSLFNHKKSHKMGQFHCSICDKTYSNLMALKNHQRTHYEAKRHPCSQCGKIFKWKRQLLRHHLIHVREGSQTDPQIPSGPEEAETIEENQEETSTVGRQASSFNNEDVSNNADQISHVGIDYASPLKPVCVSCGLSFADHDELERHACRENGLDASALGESETGESAQSENKDERPRECDVCRRPCRHAGGLQTPKSAHARGNCKCSASHKAFLRPISLKTRMRTHAAEKRFQCVDCGQSFPSSQKLLKHNAAHTGEKPFHCPTCNCRFRCELTLRHHQRTHEPLSPSQSSSLVLPTQTPHNGKKAPRSGEKLRNDKDQDDRKYKCKQCGRSYLHAGSLFNHQKTHKIGVYKCPNCLKVFSNLLAFKNHLRIHRYNCKECGKAFRSSRDLAAHSKVHEEGSFACSLCNKHFLCRSSFKRHQRIHSNQDGDIVDPQAVSNFMVEVT